MDGSGLSYDVPGTSSQCSPPQPLPKAAVAAAVFAYADAAVTTPAATATMDTAAANIE